MSPVFKAAPLILVPAVPGVYFYVTWKGTTPVEFIHIKSPTQNTFGADFQLYLAEATDSDEKINRWWKLSYEQRYLIDSTKEGADLSDEFQNLSSIENLKEKCKETYSKNTANDLDVTNKNKYRRDAWKYCSRFGGKPSTVADNASTTDQNNLKATDGAYHGNIGETKKAELVSVTDTANPVNNEFWKQRELEFFGIEGKAGLGQYNTSTKNNESKKNIFDKLYDKKGDTERDSLKDTCGNAYGMKSETGDGKVQDTEVVKHCGLKPQPVTAPAA